jgi:hypothetical protein
VLSYRTICPPRHYVRRYQYSQRQPLVIVDSLYCDTLASVVQTSGTTLHRVTTRWILSKWCCRDTCEYDLMISASLYTLKTLPPRTRCVTTPTLYANAYQVPKVLEKSGMYLRTIIHRKLLSAPDPIGEIIEVDDMYLDKVMIRWTRRRCMTQTITITSIF